MRRCAWLSVLLLVGAHAQEPASVRPAVELGTVAVTGTQPGPGLWKVSKGDHVLWILGTVSPLPRDIQWRSHDVEALIAGSAQVLTSPQVEISADAGFFGTLALLPSLIGIRNNPDGKRLEDVVSPELYTRWVALKRRYMGHSNRVEKWRPIFAALALYDYAMDGKRLTGSGYVQEKVLKTAKRAHIAVMTPSVKLTIDHPRDAIKQFKSESIQDTECFEKTIDRIDADIVTMTTRANAWATGDIAALRALPQSDQRAVCAAAISETGIARNRGMTDVFARVEHAWLDAAQAALQTNRSTFAMVPARNLLAADGYLAALKASGYVIEAPAEDAEDAAVGGESEHSAPRN